MPHGAGMQSIIEKLEKNDKIFSWGHVCVCAKG